MLEDPHNRGNEMKVKDEECHKTQEDQNQRRAVATGFHDDTKEQEVQNLLKETTVATGASMEQIQIKFPVKPITHAFLQLTDNDERDKFVRSANILKKELRGRKIRITGHGHRGKISPKKIGLQQMLHPHKTQSSARTDQNEQNGKTCIGRRTNSDQNMCKWISQIPQVSRH